MITIINKLLAVFSLILLRKVVNKPASKAMITEDGSIIVSDDAAGEYRHYFISFERPVNIKAIIAAVIEYGGEDQSCNVKPLEDELMEVTT